MISLSIGADISHLLDRFAEHPENCRELIICSPFIDDKMHCRLVGLLDVARRRQCGLRVITSPHSARQLRQRLPGQPARWRGFVVALNGLHAKIYLATARRSSESEAIVTSANLTANGISENIELGLRVVGNSDRGRELLRDIRHFVRQLAA